MKSNCTNGNYYYMSECKRIHENERNVKLEAKREETNGKKQAHQRQKKPEKGCRFRSVSVAASCESVCVRMSVRPIENNGVQYFPSILSGVFFFVGSFSRAAVFVNSFLVVFCSFGASGRRLVVGYFCVTKTVSKCYSKFRCIDMDFMDSLIRFLSPRCTCSVLRLLVDGIVWQLVVFFAVRSTISCTLSCIRANAISPPRLARTVGRK